MDKYKFIKVIKSEDGFYERAEVTYEDDKIEYITGNENIRNVIHNFIKQTGMSIDDFFNDSTKIEELLEDKVSKDTVVEEVAVTEVKRNRRSDKYKKEEEEDNKKRFLTPTVIKTAIGVITVAAIVAIPWATSRDKSWTTDPENDKRDEQTHNEFTVDRAPGSANEVYNYALEDTYSNVQEYLDESKKVISGTVSEEEFFHNLNETNQMIFSGIEELIRFLNGQGMHGNIYNIALESMFGYNTPEYVAVNKFCSMRNSILNNARSNGNINATTREIREFLDMYVKFLYQNGSIPGYSFGYYDMNEMAQFIVLQLGGAMLQPEIGYTTTINGMLCDRDLLMNDSQNLLDLIMHYWTGKYNFQK